MSNTPRFVVLGNPISHSKSPGIHLDFAAQLGLNIQYEKVLAPLDGFAQTLRALHAAGVSGANVTVPFKQQAFELASKHSPSALFAQAANTLRFTSDGVLADNTDGGGLCRDLNRLLQAQGLSLKNCRVLMIGAGGAASGCVAAFKASGVQHLSILNRTPGKAIELARRASDHGLPSSGHALHDAPAPFDATPLVVVNASSSSLSGDVPEVQAAWYNHAVLAYDMMYAAQDTPYVRFAKGLGIPGLITSDGLGMLVFQAELAFEIWTGQKPDGLKTLQRMRAALS